MRMGLLRPLYLLFAFLALSAPFTVTSAQLASVLDPARDPISDSQPANDNVLLLPLNGRLAENRIDGLLIPSKLWSRQQQVTCVTNYTACQGSQFCCPDGNTCCSGGTCCGAGTYCTAIGGVQGCCKIGHICSQIANQCTVVGQVRCPNDNFCCAAGDTCYRDANNNPRCTLSSSSSISSPSSTPLEGICRLRSTKSLGLLSRRGQTPAHRASKRRKWF